MCKVTVLRFVLSAPAAAASPERGNAGRAAPPCCFLLGESLKRERKREREREREGRAVGGDPGAGRAAAGARRPRTVDLWEEDGMRNKRTWPAVCRGAGAGCPRRLPEPPDELQWTLPAAGRRAELPRRRRRRRGGRAARPPARSRPAAPLAHSHRHCPLRHRSGHRGLAGLRGSHGESE